MQFVSIKTLHYSNRYVIGMLEVGNQAPVQT